MSSSPIISVIYRHGHGGAGKTHKLFREWVDNPARKDVFLTHSHSALANHSVRVPNSRHIQGAKRLCIQQENPLIKRWIDAGWPIKNWCMNCSELNLLDGQECPYRQQFEEMPNKILAPIHYASTQVIENFNPATIAVDDCVMVFDSLDYEKTRQFVNFCYFGGYRKHTVESIAALPDDEYKEELLRLARLYHSKLSRIETAIRETDEFDLPQHVSLKEIERVIHYTKIYGANDTFVIPLLFRLFDSKVEKPEIELMIIDALPKMLKVLKMYAERYEHETGIDVVFESEEVKHQNPVLTSQVIRILPGWYPHRQSVDFSRRTRNMFVRKVNKLMDDEHVGLSFAIVTTKRSKNYFKRKFPEAQSLTYGDLRGNNALEHFDVLFLTGTYNVNKTTLPDEFALLFPNLPRESGEGLGRIFRGLNGWADTVAETGPHNGRYVYTNAKLDLYRWLKEDYEMYQAIMRARPLNYERVVYVFGEVPDGLPEEMIRGEIELVRNNRTLEFENRVTHIESMVEQHGVLARSWLLDIFQGTYNYSNRRYAERGLARILTMSQRIEEFIDPILGRAVRIRQE